MAEPWTISRTWTAQARRRLAAGEREAQRGYLESLIELARFYHASYGVQAAAHAQTVLTAGGALTRFAEAEF